MEIEKTITFRINAEERTETVKANMILTDFIHDQLKLTGTKKGCGKGECGACTILLNGKAVNSCMLFAPQIDGKDVVTIEGLAVGDKLDPLQEAFIAKSANQCGFCTPGMILSAKGLLNENPSPTENEVRKALSGNLCRCSGYQKTTEAVLEASKEKGG